MEHERNFRLKHYDCFNRTTFSDVPLLLKLGSLSEDVFEPCTSTGSEAFSLFICLEADKFALLSSFSLIKRIYPRFWTKPLPNDAKISLPVDVRRSKTLLLTRPTSTGSEAFSPYICLEATKFVLPSFFSLITTIYSRVWTKPLPNDVKSPLPVDARRSKTPLLKLPIIHWNDPKSRAYLLSNLFFLVTFCKW